ncbi:MAG: Holliday junction resolvase RuvX [Candidatus Izemoplasmatales bacterium]|nr:Holliday junction resolvase RuvX [Candidatus Izemoplasmatales bacterium]MDD4070178.1 Holliday junction resolvase RuvX [Candidatus Izemoplasmatales bacterium]MDY0139179.1 Holliday junction resolvase RuvX [Candidatus Izemoplasmatales bacterium]
MKIVGLDLGSKTLGIAISDPSNIIANKLETITFTNNDFEYAIERLFAILKDEDIECFVLGLPKNMDGSLGFQAQVSIDFKEMLIKKFEKDVILWDERLTSKMAESMMISANLTRKKRKTKVDFVAATIILQSYLDSRKRV